MDSGVFALWGFHSLDGDWCTSVYNPLHQHFLSLQAKLWLAEESELFCNEQLCREAEQASLSQQHEHLCAMLAHAHCECMYGKVLLGEDLGAWWVWHSGLHRLR